MNVLSLNAGSSSLKFACFSFDAGQPVMLMRGLIENLGGEARLMVSSHEGEKPIEAKSMPDAVSCVLKLVPSFDAVGCRVVHGGDRFSEPTLVDDQVVKAVQELSPLAPLHNDRDLEVIRAVGSKFPVVAVFDTAFHHSLPEIARRYAIPDDFPEIRRFGFHGISYQYVCHRMGEALPEAKRLILCHLGSGASVCAVRDGKSIDTSMGMTPLEGLVMGTRSGDLDPGAVLYLIREKKLSPEAVDDLLNHKSGLRGVSEISSDARELEEAVAEGNAKADFALELFAYRIAKYIGAYSVALDGFDAIVFSGGIGENSSGIRERVCKRLGSLGVAPDLVAEPEDAVSKIGPKVWVVRTDEERQIAEETYAKVAAHLR